MDILPRSILTGPARSAAFVESNRQDQLRVAQQNAVVEVRMNALTEQGKSIMHAQQQQARAAQIQQGFQGLQNAVGGMNNNIHAIGSLEAALEESALLPSFVAAHPSVFADPLLSLHSAAQQAQVNTQVQIEPVAQPKKLAQIIAAKTSTSMVQNTTITEQSQLADATLRNAERLLGGQNFADLAALILAPSLPVKIENTGYTVSNILYDLPVFENIHELYQSAVQTHVGAFPLSSVPKVRNHCDQIRQDIVNATADTACKQAALLLFKKNLIAWQNKSDLVQPIKDALIQEIEQVDLYMDQININRSIKLKERAQNNLGISSKPESPSFTPTYASKQVPHRQNQKPAVQILSSLPETFNFDRKQNLQTGVFESALIGTGRSAVKAWQGAKQLYLQGGAKLGWSSQAEINAYTHKINAETALYDSTPVAKSRTGKAAEFAMDIGIYSCVPAGSGLRGAKLIFSSAATGGFICGLQPVADGQWSTRLQNSGIGAVAGGIGGPLLSKVADGSKASMVKLFDAYTTKYVPLFTAPELKGSAKFIGNTHVFKNAFATGNVEILAGQLRPKLAETFLGHKYSTYILKEDLILYRAGHHKRALGQYFSIEKPVSELQTRIDKALPLVWPNGSESILNTGFAVKIPKGSTIHYGPTAPQGGIHLGGTNQVIIENPMLIDGVEIVEHYPLLQENIWPRKPITTKY